MSFRGPVAAEGRSRDRGFVTRDGTKQRLREVARARRRDAHPAAAAEAASAVRRHFTAALETDFAARREAAIAGYWPIGDELDMRPLLATLATAGYLLALPLVVGRDHPLAFHRWRPDDALAAGAHGIAEPDPAVAPPVIPDIVITPLLAFDALGYRLGYGAGYYDRTLAALRAAGRVLAVGVAFAAQQVDRVPHGRGDQRLDWVVTEAGVMRMATW